MRKVLSILLISLLVIASLPVIASAQTYTVNVVNDSFNPASLSINAGDTVKWVFQNGGHTTTSGTNCSSDGKWDSGVMSQGGTFQFTFTNAGTYPYFCTIHCQMGMTGQITVSQPLTVGIQANGSTTPISIKSGDTLSISVMLASGSSANTKADWWFVEVDPTGAYFSFDVGKTPYTFDLPGIQPVFSATALFDFGFSPVYQVSGLKPGTYVFAFGVDLTPNGQLDINTLTYSAVQVTVTQ